MMGAANLWSLYDMLKLNASAFYNAISVLAHARGAVRVHELMDNPAIDKPMTVGQHDEALANTKELQSALLVLGTKVSCMVVDELLQRLNKHPMAGGGPMTHRAFADALVEIDSTMRRELSLVQAFAIEAEKAKFFDSVEPLFGTQVQTKFPSSIFEVDEAAKCLALSRPTASVFHVMRATEIGIAAVAKCLGIPDPIKPADRNWGAILRTMKGEMTRRNGTMPPSWASDDDRDFFDAVYASLDAVRNAWRNTTMHVENKYTEEEAEHIFYAVRGFMRKLAARMDESGAPLA